MGTLFGIERGVPWKAHDGITSTTTSIEKFMAAFNALYIDFLITAGAGTWTISVWGSTESAGTLTCLYTKLGLTASEKFIVPAQANYVKIIATEVVNGATVTIWAIPIIDATMGDSINVSRMSKGGITVAHSAITASVVLASCVEIDMRPYNGCRVEFLLTAGTGTWTISLYGSSQSGGTFVPEYDANNALMEISGLTSSRGFIWPIIGANFIKIVPTEVVDGATVTINVTPMV